MKVPNPYYAFQFHFVNSRGEIMPLIMCPHCFQFHLLDSPNKQNHLFSTLSLLSIPFCGFGLLQAMQASGDILLSIPFCGFVVTETSLTGVLLALSIPFFGFTIRYSKKMPANRPRLSIPFFGFFRANKITLCSISHLSIPFLDSSKLWEQYPARLQTFNSIFWIPGKLQTMQQRTLLFFQFHFLDSL